MKLRKPNLFVTYGANDIADIEKTPGRAFVEGLVSGLGGGQLFFEFNPPRYTVRDAQKGDLTRIGRDMYTAMEKYRLADEKSLTRKAAQAAPFIAR